MVLTHGEFNMFNFQDGRGPAILAALFLVSLVGCNDAPRTYPTKGKVVLPKGDVRKLAGCLIECKLEGEDQAISFGNIEEDGTFHLKTLHKGQHLEGAPEGDYQARIVSDRDDGQGQLLDPRLQAFDSSGLSFRVPSETDLTLSLTPPGGSTPRRPGSPQPSVE